MSDQTHTSIVVGETVEHHYTEFQAFAYFQLKFAALQPTRPGAC